MKAAIFALLLATVAVAKAEDTARLAPAIEPLTDGVPQVAVVRLRALLGDDSLSAEERRNALSKLAEALLAAEQPNECLQVLVDPAVRDLPASTFLKAQAFAALARWPEALSLYRIIGADAASPWRVDAIVGEAESLRALGRTDEALHAYGLIAQDQRWGVRAGLRSAELFFAKNDLQAAARTLDALQAKSAAERRERRFLSGCVELRAGNRDRAISRFASVLKSPQGAPHSLLIATLFAIADAHLQANSPATGDDFLEEFIERHPSDSDLPALFAKLDQLYAAERRQARHELGRWARDPAQPRRAFAQWYLARAELRMKNRDLARQAFDLLRVEHPPIPALAPAFLEYAAIQIQDEHFDRAMQTLDVARALHPAREVQDRVDFLTARAQYQAQKFAEAADTFQRVAYNGSPHGQDALYDATVASLQAGDAARAAANNEQLKQRGADDATRGDLRLEQGLIAASRGDTGAADALQAFIREFPKHARTSEAWVALAELAFHQTPPRLDEARQSLKRATENQPTPAAAERADYLNIWIEESAAPPNENKVIELATQFLQKYAASLFAPDVRLKLAELFFGRGDYASAQTQFTLLAQQNPNGRLAEKAQFFAAQSAMQSMTAGSLDRALVLLDEVVKKNGETKWAARNAQAVIERRLNKPQDALTLYEEVLKGDAKAPDKREALCGKGDVLYELGATSPENYKRAAESYDQLAAQSEVGSHWHNQALFKKGMCLEKLTLPNEALATFYQIVEDGSRPDRRKEFFWFYKAGFNAARLLEEQSNWKPAAAIYEKLSFAGGARSDEAKSRLNRLRLEHFLWEQ